jgi:hypothetical protein
MSKAHMLRAYVIDNLENMTNVLQTNAWCIVPKIIDQDKIENELKQKR